MMNNYFDDSYELNTHPIVILLYFVLVIMLTMTVQHPVGRIISLVGGIVTLFLIEDKQNRSRNIYLALFIIIFSGLFNFIFVKSGATVVLDYRVHLLGKLFRFKFTVEALLFGLSYGTMMSAMLIWFQVCSYLLTPEKIRYLLGNRFPTISLLISMILKMVPLIKTQINQTELSALGIGQHGVKKEQTVKERLTVVSDYFFNMFSLMLEEGLNLSDSMNSRAYGQGKRTNYSLYYFKWQDLVTAIMMLGLFVGYFWLKGREAFSYYFYMHLEPLFDHSDKIISNLFVLLIVLVPLLMKGKEWLKWKYLDSKM